jgi:hypothetical protein
MGDRRRARHGPWAGVILTAMLAAVLLKAKWGAGNVNAMNLTFSAYTRVMAITTGPSIEERIRFR